MADTSLVFNILARDKVGPTLAKLKAEVAAANDGQVSGMKLLDAAIREAETSAQKLKAEFEATGNVDVLKQFKQQSSAIRSMQRLRTELQGVRSDTKKAEEAGGLLFFALDEWFGKIAKKAGSAIVDGVQSGAQSAGKWASENPWLAAGIAAGITIGAPAIGGAMAAAVGLGGIAAGILLAKDDPRVKDAWSQLALGAKQEFTGAADVFVGPLMHGAETFGNTLDKIMPEVRQDFTILAPVADRLFTGAAGFVEKIMPGVDALTHAGGPVLSMLADELPKLGAATSMMMQSIAAGGEGGKEALHDLLLLAEGSIIVIGKVVEGLEKWYQTEHAVVGSFKVLGGDLDGAGKGWAQLLYGVDSTTRVAPAAQAAWRAVGDALNYVGTESQATSELASRVGLAAQMAGFGARIAEGDFKTLSGAISQTRMTTDVLAQQMTDKLMGSLLGVDSAMLGTHSALLNLKDAFAQNGLAIDRHTGLVSVNTKAGIANREAVLSAVQANLAMYDAQVQSGVSAEDAAKKYQTNTQALHDQLRAAGLTEAQVSDLIGEYGRVPGKVNTAIAMQGLTDAINNLDTLLQQLLGLPTHRTITIEEITKRIDMGSSVGAGVRAQRWGGVWQHAAAGYLRDAQIYQAVSSGARYAFAEPATGGEAFVPRYGNRARSMAILAHAAAWYDAAVVPRAALPGGGTVSGGRTSSGAGGVAADVHAVAAAVATAVARELPAALSRVAVVMDGQTVGRLQGRQALLLQRGG